MDAFIYSAKIVNYILKETESDLSIDIGDETVLIPSVDNNKKTVIFPYYQEALLILYEIGSQDQFLCFFLALYMLQNDDYESCEELLVKLYQSGLPHCSNAKSLYGSIVIMHLYIMLHECGHYLSFSDRAFDYLSENTLIKDTFFSQDFESVKEDDVKSFYTEAAAECDVDGMDMTDFIDEIAQYDVRRNAKEYFTDINKSIEAKADVLALLMMRLFATPILSIKDVDVLRAISFVDIFTFLVLLIEQGNKEEDITKYRQQFGINNTRTRVSSTIACLYFDEDESLSVEQFTKNVFQKGVMVGMKIDEYQKYFDSWMGGNNREKDENRYKYLLDGIYNYFLALKELYQHEE